MGKIFLDVDAIVSGNLFNVKEMINAINDLLKSYGVNGAEEISFSEVPFLLVNI